MSLAKRHTKADDAKILRWARRRIAPAVERARLAHESKEKGSNLAPYDVLAMCLENREERAEEVSIPLWAAEALVREGERLAFEGPTKGQLNRLRDAQVAHFIRQGMDRKAVAREMKVSVKAVDRARRNGFGYYSLLVHRQGRPGRFGRHPEDFGGASLLGWDLDGRESEPAPRITRKRRRSTRR